MRIYILSNQTCDGFDIVCASENIRKIRDSICKDLNPNEDFPKFEIWEDGKVIYRVFGNHVLKDIAKEINIMEE